MAERVHLVVAEDNEDDIMILLKALQRAGIQEPVRICRDGEEVLEYFMGAPGDKDRAEAPFAELLILDLKMPYLGGLEVLELLRKESASILTPVIILTSSKNPGDIERAYKLGCNAYLVKPSTVEELVNLFVKMHKFWSACELPARP